MYASQPHVFETVRLFLYMGLEIASIRIEAVAFVKDLFSSCGPRCAIRIMASRASVAVSHESVDYRFEKGIPCELSS